MMHLDTKICISWSKTFKIKVPNFYKRGKKSCGVLWVFNENQTKGNYHHKWTGTAQRRRWLLCSVAHPVYHIMPEAWCAWLHDKKNTQMFLRCLRFFCCKYFWFSWVFCLFLFLLLLLFFTGMVIQLSESHTSNLLGNGNKASVYIKLANNSHYKLLAKPDQLSL